MKGRALTGCKQFHDQGYKGQGIRYAILDTGTFPHADFGNRRLTPIVFSPKPNDINDSPGHGTKVAGVFAGEYTGIAPLAEIQPIVVANAMNEWNTNALISGLQWCLEHHAEIDGVNMSCGWPPSANPSFIMMLESLIDQLDAKNVPVFAAMGNTGKYEFYYPGACKNAISVGSISLDMKHSYFSTMNEHIDFCQIGESAKTTKSGGGYDFAVTGTSFACPRLAGIAALIQCKYKAQNNGSKMSSEMVYQTLRILARDIGIKGFDKETGAGFVTLGTGKMLTFVTDTNILDVNGNKKTLDVGPTMIKDRNVMPGRHFTENLSGEVFWDGNKPLESSYIV